MDQRPSPPKPAGDSRTDYGPDLREQVRQLGEHLERAHSSEAYQPDLLVADLETAYEELRVADEEVRTQRETIDLLLESSRGLRLQQERTMAILPVPIVVTDMQGMIRSVNAAAAMLVGVRAARMLGKPIFGFFTSDDRQDLRRQLSARGREGRVIRRAATMLSRTTAPIAVEVTASVNLPGAGAKEVSWVVLDAGEPADRGGLVTEALTELAMLARQPAPAAAVFEAAAEICARALGADVTVALGPPLEPTAVTSSSARAQQCDGVQVRAEEGPTITAYCDRVTVVAAVDESGGWPEDVGTVAATVVESGDRVVGTLTAYGPPEAVAGETLELLAVTLGGVAHELELQAELVRLELDMERALTSRAVIDQAKGILMASLHLDANQAWEHLLSLSSTEHRKLREVAQGIVDRAPGGR